MQQIKISDSDNKSKFPTKEEIMTLVFEKYRRISIMALLFLILLMSLFASMSYTKGKTQKARDLYSKYINTKNTESNTFTSKSKKQVIIPSDDAVDSDKLNKEISTAEQFWKDIFTYTNGKEYNDSRSQLIKLFGKKSEMVKNIFTENVEIKVDGNDQTYNRVDQEGANMQTESILTYPLEINKDDNDRYVSFISYRITTSGNANVYDMLSIFYDVDQYGSIIDPKCYLLNNNQSD